MYSLLILSRRKRERERESIRAERGLEGIRFNLGKVKKGLHGLGPNAFASDKSNQIGCRHREILAFLSPPRELSPLSRCKLVSREGSKDKKNQCILE